MWKLSIQIVFFKLGISVGIGLTDFIIRSVKRNSKKKKAQKNKNQNITISTIENDPTATKITLDKEHSPEETPITVEEN